MSILNQLNINYLRVFETVYRLKSMTKAAEQMHLTQSGISQQIKSLEEILGVSLFDRINKQLVPTSEAGLLYSQCAKGFQDIETTLRRITKNEHELLGIVKIGIPEEFGNGIILPLLAPFSKQHKGVDFRFTVGLASTMNSLLLNGEIDFAYIDEFALDKRIETKKVFDEVLELCISPTKLKQYGKPKHQKSFYQSLEYIEYVEGSPVLKMWFKHHLKGAHIDPKIRACVMNAQSVARLIIDGVGAGVIPQYLMKKLKKEGRSLQSFKGLTKPLNNAISVAFLKNRTLSQASEAAKDWLSEQLAKM